MRTPGADARPRAPRLVAVAGGRAESARRRVAVNLAIAPGARGRRTLLVDADPQRADVAAPCGLSDGYGLADVLAGSGRCTKPFNSGRPGFKSCRAVGQQHAALTGRRGAAAIDSRSARSGATRGRGSARRWQRRSTPVPRHFWRAADEVVLVTSPDSVAVMDAYAAVKTHLRRGSQPPRVATLVNQATDPLVAARRPRLACSVPAGDSWASMYGRSARYRTTRAVAAAAAAMRPLRCACTGLRRGASRSRIASDWSRERCRDDQTAGMRSQAIGNGRTAGLAERCERADRMRSL